MMTPKWILEFTTEEEFKEAKRVLQQTTGLNIEQARAMDRHKRVAWTDYEKDLIISMYALHPVRYIAKEIGRSMASTRQVVHQLQKMGLLRKKTNRNGKILTQSLNS